MRLLDTTTLKLTEFTRDVPPYAILSHTWGDEEVTFQEIDLPERDKKKGFAKIRWCCQQAKHDALEWAWVDTCCIDKTSSAELSEAINSMYNWYREAQVCYVYMEDVPDPDSDRFCSARWFTRGWCLQELIAPRAVEFYSADWREIGTKLSLCEQISEITGIPKEVLLNPDSALDQCCLAERMSWASARKTSRVEDEAYCLLGIFGVHMPLLYGEGERAFFRLQEEIIRHTEDYSFLLWSIIPDDHELLADLPVFAPRPAYFLPDNLIQRSGPDVPTAPRTISYRALRRDLAGSWLGSSSPAILTSTQLAWDPPQMTNRGLRVSLPGRPVPDDERWIWREDAAVHLFTGFSYNGYAVCVRLVQNQWTGPACYRRSESLVQLFHPRVIAESFAPRPLYLSTARRHRSNNDSAASIVRSNNPIKAWLVVNALSPKRTVLSVASAELPISRLPNAPQNLSAGFDDAGEVVGSWAGRLYVSPNSASAHALDVTIQRDVGLLRDSPPPQTVRVHMNLLGRPGQSTCALWLVSEGQGRAVATASDRARCGLESGWFATASIKTVIRSRWLSEITLTFRVHAGSELN
jgi:hypothetical protein